MATYWRTEPIMDNSPQRERLRPRIYVHVEFGVSWYARQPPRHHELAYRSRTHRERSPSFPRQVPAPNTNFLTEAGTASQQQHQHHQNQPQQLPLEQQQPQPQPQPQQQQHHHSQQQRSSRHHNEDYRHYDYSGQSRQSRQPQQSRDLAVEDYDDHASRRPSRAASRSTHERGRSAPPPFGDNPWDVNVQQPQAEGLSSLVATASRPAPEVWKDLPEVPARFRLGEDGMPWSSWSWPMGYDPDAYPQDDEEEQPGASSSPNARGKRRESVSAHATSPVEVSVFSPGPSGQTNRPNDPGRIRELGALSAAMMTVDNGFENQWWYQGERQTVTFDQPEPVGPPTQNSFSSRSVGWAVASASAARDDRLSFAMANVVSPITDYAYPDTEGTFSRHNLTRTLSTRSEELFFTEGGLETLSA